jgi:alpha/beta superfamily hydrolase
MQLAGFVVATQRAAGKMNKIQSTRIKGPAGQLEGVLKFDESVAPRALAVVCHPHPLFQGTMHNKVAFATAEAFFALGCEVLRFNFRGAGLSQGVHDSGKGEVEDALAAVQFLKQRHSSLPCHIAGFSFGAWIAMEAANRDEGIASLTAVAPSFKQSEAEFLTKLTIPKLFLQGTADNICPPDGLRSRYPSFAAPKEAVWFTHCAERCDRGELSATGAVK